MSEPESKPSDPTTTTDEDAQRAAEIRASWDKYQSELASGKVPVGEGLFGVGPEVPASPYQTTESLRRVKWTVPEVDFPERAAVMKRFQESLGQGLSLLPIGDPAFVEGYAMGLFHGGETTTMMRAMADLGITPSSTWEEILQAQAMAQGSMFHPEEIRARKDWSPAGDRGPAGEGVDNFDAARVGRYDLWLWASARAYLVDARVRVSYEEQSRQGMMHRGIGALVVVLVAVWLQRAVELSDVVSTTIAAVGVAAALEYDRRRREQQYSAAVESAERETWLEDVPFPDDLNGGYAEGPGPV